MDEATNKENKGNVDAIKSWIELANYISIEYNKDFLSCVKMNITTALFLARNIKQRYELKNGVKK